jgi:phosphate transport system protein
MYVHLQREIANLKKSILRLGAICEERVRESVKSFLERDAELAKKVVAADEEIDRMEVGIEEECLKILALHQPVAVDLRFIVAVLKINNDLERIGDLAVAIAKRAVRQSSEPPGCGMFHIPEMAERVQEMVKNCLDALVNSDTALARQVCEADERVDDLNRDTLIEVRGCILDDVNTIKGALRCLEVSRRLERIADQSTNIAEDVIYMIEGQIIRHPHAISRPQPDTSQSGDDES